MDEKKLARTANELSHITRLNRMTFEQVLQECNNQVGMGNNFCMPFGKSVSQETMMEFIKIGCSVSNVKDFNGVNNIMISWE